VEEAILIFANGFLVHPDNNGLRDNVTAKTIKADKYYRNLLHLIYRTLFLLVIEERNLVYPLSPDMPKRDLYYQYYSLQRLRRLSEKRHLADHRHADLWQGLLATFWLFEDGGPGHKLGIAPLDGDLFSSDSIGPLREYALDNETLMSCFRSLCLYQSRQTNQLIRVNYASLNVEEFGSVYEGLLEYEPIFTHDGNKIEFSFVHGDQRAATGSHYTPDDLVQPLLRHSLDHLIAEKLKAANPEKALLSLRVADISCGSGHILLAAARRIATELAIIQTGEEQPSPTAFRTAVRDVIRSCIYGVDLNPLAVELCKVALWLEAHAPGEPLNFLDHHIKCGNAIVGFDRREELERGVPDEAFSAMPGDDKKIASLFRKRNRKERKKAAQTKLDLMTEVGKSLTTIHQSRLDVSNLPEHTPADIAVKKQSYYNSTKSTEAWFLDQIASIPLAQFYIHKTSENQERLINDNDYRLYLSRCRTPRGQATAMAWALKKHKRFFHWFLEFPEVIEQGGFDCILGNPPYLGGQDLSGTYGHAFCRYVKWEYAPAGLSDLVVYFVRRIYNLLRPGGFTAFITTNSIKDGDVRKDGLEQILAQEGCINLPYGESNGRDGQIWSCL
jgi:methylase of polypeptide subunit release factors